jgi:hypothetical protein
VADVEKPNLHLKIIEVAERSCVQILVRLGLTPRDRSSVRPTAPPKPPPDPEMERMKEIMNRTRAPEPEPEPEPDLNAIDETIVEGDQACKPQTKNE